MANGPSIEQLRKATQDRPDKHDFYMWGVMRKISTYVTWIAVRTSITPNQITLFSMIFGLAGASFFASANPLYWIVGWAVVNVHLILDQVDGEVARWRKAMTKFGYFFDEITHPIVNTALFVAVSIGVYSSLGDVRLLFIGLALVFSASIVRMTGVYSDYVMGTMYRLRATRIDTPKSWARRIGGIPSGLGGYFHMFAFAALLDMFATMPAFGGFAIGGFRGLFFLLAALAMPLFCVKKIAKLRKTLKDSRL
ncbi:MAG: CDP-alcohol phosphatidyltransferase family protein [Candidatus Aenigmarchaeota archaeon]|nr:CDP-alcohol phosphatidyltransferase family protein [Candidatus Aenigmarchaeota archaeon]